MVFNKVRNKFDFEINFSVKYLIIEGKNLYLIVGFFFCCLLLKEICF